MATVDGVHFTVQTSSSSNWRGESDPREIEERKLAKIAQVFSISMTGSKEELRRKVFNAVYRACKKQEWGKLATIRENILGVVKKNNRTIFHKLVRKAEPSIIKKSFDFPELRSSEDLDEVFHYAVSNRPELINFLHEYVEITKLNGAGLSLLHVAVACDEDRESTIELLLGMGAKPDLCCKCNDLLPSIFALDKTRDVDLLLSPVALAVALGKTDYVDLLVKKQPDLLNEDIAPFGNLLHLAIASGQNLMLYHLLTKHHSQTDFLLKMPHDHLTPLLFAAKRGKEEALKWLLKVGANTEIRDNHLRTALHLAAQHGHSECIQRLIYSKADLEARDRDGKTPLGLAKDPSEFSNAMHNAQKNNYKMPQVTNPKYLIFDQGTLLAPAFLEAWKLLEESHCLSELERVSGSAEGALFATLVAFSYDSKELNEIFENILSPLLAEDKRDLRNFVEVIDDLISKKTGIKSCTFGELNTLKREGKPLRHLYLTYSSTGSTCMCVNSQESSWQNVVIADMLLIAISRPGTHPPHPLCVKDPSNPHQKLKGKSYQGHVDFHNPFNKMRYVHSVNTEDEGDHSVAINPFTLVIRHTLPGSIRFFSDSSSTITIQDEESLGLNCTSENQKILLKALVKKSCQKVLENKGESIEQLPLSPATLPPFVDFASQVTAFVGREEALKTIQLALLPSADWKPFTPSKLFVIHAPSGMGKSELSRKFAETYKHHFYFISWINGKNDTTRQKSYRDLAAKLRLSLPSPLTPEDLYAKIDFHLSNHQFNKPWLLILDDVQEPLQSQFPHPTRGGCILGTSHTLEVWPNLPQNLLLKPFSEEEATTLIQSLSSHLTLPPQKRHAKALANHWGGLPLAVHRGAFYCSSHSTGSWDEMVKNIKQATSQVIYTKKGDSYSKSLFEMWQMTKNHLERNHPLVLNWLNWTAYISTAKIPCTWIEDGLSDQLINYGLARWNNEKEAIYLHELQQEVIRLSQENQNKIYFQKAFAFLLDKGKALCELLNRDHLEEIETWIVHAKHIQENTLSDCIDVAIHQQMKACKQEIYRFLANFILDQTIQDFQDAPLSLRSKKDAVLAVIKKDGRALRFASDELKDDPEVALAAGYQNPIAFFYFASPACIANVQLVPLIIQRYPWALRYAEKLKADPSTVELAIRNDLSGEVFQYVDASLQSNPGFVERMAHLNPAICTYISHTFKEDRKFMLGLIEKNRVTFSFANQKLQEDKTFIISSIRKNPGVVAYLNDKYKDDEELIRAALELSGLQFQHASRRLRKDQTLALCAIKNDPQAILFCHDILLYSRRFILDVVKQTAEAFKHFYQFNSNLDKNFILEAVRANCQVYLYLNETFKSDYDVALAAISQQSQFLEHVPLIVLKNPQFIQAAHEINTEALGFASNKLRNDPKFMLDCIKRDPTAMKYASDRLRGNPSFVIDALRYDVRAHHYMAEELKNLNFYLNIATNFTIPLAELPLEVSRNPKIIKATLEKNGLELAHIAEKCKTIEIILVAISQNYQAFTFVPEKLKHDLDFLELALQKNCRVLEFIAPLFFTHPIFKQAAVVQAFLLRAIRDGSSSTTVFNYVPDIFKDNEEFIIDASHIDSDAYSYASPRLRDSYPFAVKMVKIHPELFGSVSISLRNNPNFILEVISYIIRSYSTFPGDCSLWEDTAFVKKAVDINGEALKFASEECKKDPEIVSKAVQNRGQAFRFSSLNLRHDENLILTAIKNDPSAIQYASESSLNQALLIRAMELNPKVFNHLAWKFKTQEFILRLIDRFPIALESLPRKYFECHDLEIVKQIVSKNGLGNVDIPSYKSDQIILLLAISHNHLDFLKASDELKNNPNFIKLCVLINKNVLDLLPTQLRSSLLTIILADFGSAFQLIRNLGFNKTGQELQKNLSELSGKDIEEKLKTEVSSTLETLKLADFSNTRFDPSSGLDFKKTTEKLKKNLAILKNKEVYKLLPAEDRKNLLTVQLADFSKELDLIRELVFRLETAPKHMHRDMEALLPHLVDLPQEPNLTFQQASEKLRNDWAYAMGICIDHPLLVRYVSLGLLSNDAFLLAVLSKDPIIMRYAPVAFRENKDFVLKAMKMNGLALEHVSAECQQNQEIVCAAMENNGMALKFTISEWQKDPTIVRYAVTNQGKALQFAASEWQKDSALVLQAIENDAAAIVHAHKSLKLSLPFLKHAFDPKKNIMQCLYEFLERHEEMLMSDTLFLWLSFLNDEVEEEKLKHEFIEDLIERLNFLMRFMGKVTAIETKASKRNKPQLSPKEFIKHTIKDKPNYISKLTPKFRREHPNFLTEVLELVEKSARPRLALDLLDVDGMFLECASEEMREDRSVVLKAFIQNPRAFKFIGKGLRQSPEFINEILAIHRTNMLHWNLTYEEAYEAIYQHLPDNFKHDVNFILSLVDIDEKIFHMIPPELHGNRDFILKYASQYPKILQMQAANPLFLKRAFVKEILQQSGLLLEYLPAFQDNEEMVIEAIKQNPAACHFASKKLKNDIPFISKAYTIHKSIMRFIYNPTFIEKLIAAKDFEWLRDISIDDRLLAVIKHNPEAVQFVSKPFQSSQNFLLKALSANKNTLKFITNEEFLVNHLLRYDTEFPLLSEELKKRPSFLAKLLNLNPGFMCYVEVESVLIEELVSRPDRIHYLPKAFSNASFFLKVFERNENILKMVHEEAIWIEIIKTHLKAIRYAPDNNISLMEKLVTLNGLILEFYPKPLKSNPQVVLKAVNQNGLALKFANYILQDNEEIVIAACSNQPQALVFASRRLQAKYQDGSQCALV